MQIMWPGSRGSKRSSRPRLSNFSIHQPFLSHLEREMYSSMSSFKAGNPTEQAKGRGLFQAMLG